MKHLTIEVPEKKYPFMLELVRNLGFAKIEDEDHEPTKEEILQGIREAVEEVKLAKQGKIKLQSAEEFLNEL